MPTTIAFNETITVEIKINKGSISNFAKYQMEVPTGVKVTEGDSTTGNFTFEGNRAKIVWVSVPTEPEFIATMKLNSGNVCGEHIFTNKFYYLDNGVKKEVDGGIINASFTHCGITTKTLSPIESKTKAQPVIDTITKPLTRVIKAEAKTTLKNSVVHKLQLGAYTTNPGLGKYAAIGKVSTINEDGLVKVVYGNFSTKEEALKKREELSNKGFKCFVVEYLNGVKIK
jgi:hypothetical protein